MPSTKAYTFLHCAERSDKNTVFKEVNRMMFFIIVIQMSNALAQEGGGGVGKGRKRASPYCIIPFKASHKYGSMKSILSECPTGVE